MIKKAAKILCVCAAFCTYISSMAHEVHISYSRIHISDSAIIVLSKMYEHDFDYILYDVPKTNVSYTDSLKVRFFNQFSVSINGVNVDFSVDSITVYDEMYWVYVYAELPKKPTVISISNQIMCNLFENQKNLCVVSYGKKEEGYILDCENKKIHVTL